MSNGEVVKQSLADDAGLDEDVISVKLALDVVAVLERGTMEMLIAAVAAQRLHVGHPEMVGEGTDLAHCLLEGVLDLEAQAVETNDIDGVKGSVCAHEEAGTSGGMDHGDEAHQPAGGTPQQVADPILDDHLVLAVDGAWGWLEVAGGLPQGAELDLAAIDPGAASLARPPLLVSGIGDGVGLHPGEQVVVLLEQAGDDLVGGIVGVGDGVEGLSTAAMPRSASILSSRVRRSRLDHTSPSWMRTASGTAKKLEAA